jgi:hypothetical protein
VILLLLLLSLLKKKIIPFFLANPLHGSKSLKLEAFKKAFLIIKDKEHLKEKGLEELKKNKKFYEY